MSSSWSTHLVFWMTRRISKRLTDICTPREICDLSQRLQVARYLDEGEPYVEVQARTGASSTTVSRVSKALNGEYGGYRKILIKLEDGE